MTVIGELAVNAVVRTEGAARGAKSFRAEVGGMRQAAAAAKPAILAIGTAVTTAFALVADRAGKFDALVNSADRLGIGVERLQELNYAADQTANITGGVLVNSLANLNRQVAEAAHGSGKAQTAIRELGLDARTLSAVPADEMLLRLADAMRNVTSAADRERLAKRLGLDGNFLTLLAQGRAGIEGVAGDARNMNAVLDETSARSLANTNDELAKMYVSLNAAGDAAAAGLAPGVAYAADQVVDLISVLQDYGQQIGYWIEGGSAEETKDNARADRGRQNMVRGMEMRERRRQIMAELDAERAAREPQREVTPKRAEVDEREELRLKQVAAAREANNRALEREQELQQRAASIIERNLTPLEKLRAELEEISWHHVTGRLTTEQAERGVNEAGGEFANANAAPRRGTNAPIRFDSAEAYRAIKSSERENDVPKKSLKQHEKANELLQEIRDQFASQKALETMVAPWN